MLGRSRSLAGPCIIVRNSFIFNALSEADEALSPISPFPNHGSRDLYTSLRMCSPLLLPLVKRLIGMIAADALLCGPDGRTHARPLRLRRSARLGAHQEYPFRHRRVRDRCQLLVVPRCRVGYRRPYQRALGTGMETGAF